MKVTKSNTTTQSVASPRNQHYSITPIVTFTFDLWPPKSIEFILSPWLICLPTFINKHTMVKYLFTSSFSYVQCDLELWTLTYKINRVYSLIMVNMLAKFDEEGYNGLVSIVFTSLFPIFHTCQLWPWPLTSKINRVHPLTMANMSAKFDKVAHNGLVSIMFTSLIPYMSIVTLTVDLWPPKSIGSILSLWLICLPSLMKKHTTVKSLSSELQIISCSQAYFHIQNVCQLWPWHLTSDLQNQ